MSFTNPVNTADKELRKEDEGRMKTPMKKPRLSDELQNLENVVEAISESEISTDLKKMGYGNVPSPKHSIVVDDKEVDIDAVILKEVALHIEGYNPVTNHTKKERYILDEKLTVQNIADSFNTKNYIWLEKNVDTACVKTVLQSMNIQLLGPLRIVTSHIKSGHYRICFCFL